MDHQKARDRIARYRNAYPMDVEETGGVYTVLHIALDGWEDALDLIEDYEHLEQTEYVPQDDSRFGVLDQVEIVQIRATITRLEFELAGLRSRIAKLSPRGE